MSQDKRIHSTDVLFHYVHALVRQELLWIIYDDEETKLHKGWTLKVQELLQFWTNDLTPWSQVLGKAVVSQLVNKLFTAYEIQSCITTFTRAYHRTSEPHESSPHPHSLFLLYFHIILPPKPRSSRELFPSDLGKKVKVMLSLCFNWATRH